MEHSLLAASLPVLTLGLPLGLQGLPSQRTTSLEALSQGRLLREPRLSPDIPLHPGEFPGADTGRETPREEGRLRGYEAEPGLPMGSAHRLVRWGTRVGRAGNGHFERSLDTSSVSSLFPFTDEDTH